MKSILKLSGLNRLLAVILLMLYTCVIQAKQIPTVTGILKTSSVSSTTVTAGTPSASNTILVPALSNAADYNIRNTISLKYDLATDTFFLAQADVKVKVTINRWDAANNPLPATSRKLRVSINNKLGRPVLEESSVNLTNGYKITMTVDSIWVNGIAVKTLPRYVSVESEINMDRYYDFSSSSNTSSAPTGITPLDNDCDGVYEELQITWSVPPSTPEEYQLEWTYVNNYSSTGGSYPAGTFVADFKNNSTRITTYDNSYKLSLLFDKGFIAFRIRAVGRDYLNPSQFVYGPWSAADQVNMGTLGASELYAVTTEHEKIKNWQYSSTYAEEGKKKEVINYFDGSLHNRQTVTKVNSDKNVIVGETMYDYQGRPAVNILPVPVVMNCTTATAEPAIKYYTKFNVDDTNHVYSKNDFDLDIAGTCNSAPAPMDTVSGASRYYSNNNPDQSRQQSYLPHAKEYPFTQIEYTPDNTGRIRNQSGVGKDYQLGSGKETKYLYGQPNQIQVDRLFGSETGDASHFKKNVVIDANGQTSVTYMNQEGKTIATALAGIPPTIGTSTTPRLDSLDYAGQNQHPLTIDLFNKNALGVSALNTIPASNDQLDFSTQLLVAFRSQYDFKYTLQVDTLGDACLRNNICLSCVYDMEIQVKDECGNNLVTSVTPFKPIKRVTGKVDTTGNMLTFNIHCTSPNLFKDSAKVSLILQPGVYTVSKILKINQPAKDFYVKNYLDSANNSCVKTLHQFQAAELAKIDTSDCYNTCASCAAALGTKDDYVSSGQGTAEQWDFLIDQCLDPCREKTLCQNTYEMMLSDVSPGGQYGKFNSSTYSAASEPLSVYNTSNTLNPNIIPGMQASWQHPFMRLNGNTYNLYLDENGVRTRVNLTEISPGVFQPPVTNSSLVYVDPASSLKYTYPENLQNLADFIPLWDPNFAKSLVVFHPEYAYYVSCSEHAVKFPGDNRSSDVFDSLLLVTETFSQALATGFIKSNYNTTTAAQNKIKDIWLTATGNYDPFFTNNNFQYTTSVNSNTGTKTNINMSGAASYNVNLQSQMDYIINHYRTVGTTVYTMADIAAIVTRCGNNFGATPTATCLAFGRDFYPTTTPLNDSIRDKEWRLYRQFYFSEKQKLQYKRMDFYAKHGDDANSNYYGGCNICIGNASYNAFTAGMIITAPGPVPYPVSAYFDLSQPCGYATQSNYGGVTKRFYDPANTGLNTGSVAQQVYQTTGQCPMAFQLQNFLSSMSASTKLTSPTAVNLNTVGEFDPDMYTAVSGGVTPASFINYQWQVVSSSGPVFTANIVNPVTSGVQCTVTLDKTGTLITNFSNITGFTQLAYDPSGTGPGAFTAVVVYTSGTSTLSANIKGNSCINIRDCNFAPQCVPNQFASEIGNMVSYLKTAGLLLSTSPVAISTDTTLNKFLTPTIKNTLGTPNSNVMYQFVSGNKLTFYDNANPGTKIVLTVTLTPSGVASSIVSFANIRSNYNNLFKMDGMNVSNAKIADVDGKAEITTPTQTIGISMGSCGLPDPPQCDEKEHHVRRNLELLVSEVLSTKPFNSNVNLYTLASFSSLLKSYEPTTLISTNSNYTTSTSPGPNFDTLTINMGNNGAAPLCKFRLFHYRNDGSTNNFPAITNVTHLTGIGTPDIAGNYTYFSAIATYTSTSGTTKDTIYGVSCWPLKNCDACPPKPAPLAGQTKADSINVAQGKAYYDPNLPAYDIYKGAVDSLNARLGWAPASASYVAPMDYLTYTGKGFINAGPYVKFVANFDTLIDSKVMLVPDSFVYSYGNLTNCNKEYSRYMNSVAAYNIRATSAPGAALMQPIKDSTFYSNHLCDNSYQFISYLRKYPHAGLNPSGILPFFGISTVNPVYTDSCKKLYEKYIRVHAQFASNGTVQAHCKEANINHPLYSYDEISKANLCCTSPGIAAFNTYIGSLATASVSCPQALPSLNSCSNNAAFASDQNLCQRYYTTFKTKINQFNASAYSASHSYTLDVNIYPTFYSFQEAGYCDCVLNYISYLNTYISAPATSTLTVPSDIDHYGSCPHDVSLPQDSCRKLYETYVQSVNAYNNFVKNNPQLGYPPISTIFKIDEFIKSYCICAPKFIANLNGIVNGVRPTPEQLKLMLNLPSSCEKPCNNGPQDSAFVFPPYTKYDNPCVQQQINLALENAANAYQQYIDSMTTAFADKYTRHCLAAIENFTYRYVDKEYHYTLYYYDQAGNLIRTIPPEGVEFVPVTSYLDNLEKKIISDRTYGQQNVFTAHRMATTYVYNSLNQLIYQSLPDHDNMDICEGTNPNGLDTGLVINSVQFVTANKGYLCGYIRLGSGNKRGYVYTSNDGGNFWTKVNGVTSGDLQKVQFVSATLGYAVSNYGMVFTTQDGGNTWDLLTGLYNPVTGGRFTGTLNDLYFTSSIGLVGGNKQSGITTAIFYTSNGGATFSPASMTGIANGDTITGFTFDNTTYMASARNGNTGKLFTSTNGTSWTQVTAFAANNLRKVQFIANNMAYAVGEEGTLMKLSQAITTSSPPQWTLLPTGLLGHVNDVYFKNATDGVAIVDSIPGKAKLWKTFDGGLTWQLLSAPGDYYTSLQLYDPTQDRLIAAGKKGLLAKVLMHTPPFGMIKILTPYANNNSYADVILHTPTGSLRSVVVSDASPILYTSYDVQVTAPVWLSVNTTTLSPPVPSADASFKKVLMCDSVLGSPYIKAVLLTTTGKLYSFYRAYGSASVICRPVSIAGSHFFIDITSNNQTFTTPVYALDTVTKQVYALNFSGTLANATALINSAPVTKNIVSIDIHDGTNKLMMAGNTGHIEYTPDITTTPVVWTDVTFSTTPVSITKVRAVSANNFIATGIDGAVWKNALTASTWYLRNSGTVEKLNSIAVDNTGNGLVAANNGKLFKLSSAQTPNPALLLLPALLTAHLTDVAIQPAGITAYATAANGKVLYMANYNTPSPSLASAPSVLSVNGVAYKPGANAVVVGNNAHIANYYALSAIVTKSLFTKGLNSIHFYDVNNGLVIDSNDVVRRTADGGNTWSVVIPTNGSPALTRVYSTATNQGVLIGKNKYAYTVNGTALSLISVPTTVPAGTDFYDINFNSAVNYGVIVGSASRAAKIVPSGSGFAVTYIGQAVGGPKIPDFRAVHVFNNNTFIAAGTRGSIYYNKAGLFTQQMNYTAPAGLLQSAVTLKDIYFHDNYAGYVVGSNGAAYKVLLSDSIGTLGTSVGALGWFSLCSDALYMSYSSSTQIRKLDFRTIAFSNRTNGMIAGADSNVVIGSFTPNRYARLIREQSGYYSTRFWYDKLGRLILSQNTKQFNKKNPASPTVPQKAYSYTLYDPLGRIFEVGEKYENQGTGLPVFSSIFGSLVNGYYNNNAIDDAKLLAWVSASGPRREVTRTYYDVQSILPGTYTQKNLRKRVASTTFEDVFDGNDLTYNHATHYTYDIHGNVNTLWQENTKVAVTGQNIKQIDYEFDLISGKVNKVIYSPAQPDQFIHRYTYDADNRITKVETSVNDIHYDIDAKYFYYAHGPLARVEYGKDHVQGMDYAYTLQGWIKGVNSNTLKKAKDMGSDGDNSFANANGNFARDVVGYTLNYYQGDYEAINFVKWNTATSRFEAYTNNSDLFNARNDLFNGNITSMVTSISKVDSTAGGVIKDPIALPMGNAYRYDQLNRIKRSLSYTNIDTLNNTWLNNNASIAGLYLNTFSYDANGNILTQVKRDSVGSLIDSLVYNYEMITAGKKKRNRLYHVNDFVTTTPANFGDIKDEGLFSAAFINTNNNYGFDEIGNLVRDKAEEIDTIRWMVTGKIKAIVRKPSSTKDNLYFDYDAQGNRVAKHVYTSANVWKNSTYYLRDAQGNVMSVYNKKVTGTSLSYKLNEQHLYGSSRIGMTQPGYEMIGALASADTSKSYLGLKQYELSNHLGNVLTVISDKKIQIANATNPTLVDHYVSDQISASDYYPFGSVTKGRNFSSHTYRYGFNGKEKDDEVSGSGNEYDYGMRIYDPRLGRFLTIDPVTKRFPHYSPFQYAGNKPVWEVDIDGAEDPPGGPEPYTPAHLSGVGAVTWKFNAPKGQRWSAGIALQGGLSPQSSVLFGVTNANDTRKWAFSASTNFHLLTDVNAGASVNTRGEVTLFGGGAKQFQLGVKPIPEFHSVPFTDDKLKYTLDPIPTSPQAYNNQYFENNQSNTADPAQVNGGGEGNTATYTFGDDKVVVPPLQNLTSTSPTANTNEQLQQGIEPYRKQEQNPPTGGYTPAPAQSPLGIKKPQTTMEFIQQTRQQQKQQQQQQRLGGTTTIH